MRKDKIWEVDLFDQRPYSQQSVKQLSNPEFWTSDTEAFLVFKLFNNVVPDSATLNLYNRDDKSLVVDLPMVINNQDVELKLTDEIIAHFGSWSAQTVFSIDGESYTASTVSFSVGRELGADLPERLGLIEDWKNLNDEVKSFVAEIEGFTLDQFVELKMGEELQNLEVNYATRLTGLESNDANLTAQLAQTADYAQNNLRPDKKENMCIVTFTSDDAQMADMTKTIPLFQQKGVTYTIAIPPNYTPNLSQSYLNDLKTLQDRDGFEVVSHTFNHINLTTLDEAGIEFELKESQKWLKDNGFKGHDIMVYPQGGNNDLIRKLTRKYYKVGIGTLPNNGINEYPLRMYDIARVGLGSYFNTDGGLNRDPRFPLDGSTLEYYKARVDYALANKQWLIFMMHPWHAAHTEVQQQHIRDLIDYIESKNIPIKNVSDALDIVGNTVDVGDYHYGSSSKEYLAVGANGSTKSSQVDKKLSVADTKINLVEDFNFENLGLQSYSASNPATVDVTISTDKFKEGTRSLKIKRLSNLNGYSVYSVRNPSRFKGKWITVSAWVMCPKTNSGIMRVGMQDGLTFTLSDPIPNDGEWHFVTIKQLISASSTAVQTNYGRVLSNSEAIANDIMYVDSSYVLEGEEMVNAIGYKPMYTGVDLTSTAPSTEGSIAYNSNFLFISPSPNTWRRVQTVNGTEYVSTNKHTPATPLLDYTAYTITVTPVTTQFAIDNGFPKGLGGHLWTHRINADHSLCHQVYETIEGDVFRRSFNSSAVPQAWKKPDYQWVNA